MTVTLPALSSVAPGNPITAELMNSILTSLTTLQDYLNQRIWEDPSFMAYR